MNGPELQLLEALDRASPPPPAAPITPETLARRARNVRRRRVAAVAAVLLAATGSWFATAAAASDARADEPSPVARQVAAELQTLHRRVDALLARVSAPTTETLRPPRDRAWLRYELARARADALVALDRPAPAAASGERAVPTDQPTEERIR